MPHRTFSDASGRVWDVWSVVPNVYSQRAADADAAPTEFPRAHEAFTDPRWANGWLAFQTSGEKRRLSPIPDTWMQLDDTGLEQLCAAAALVQPSRRLVE